MKKMKKCSFVHSSMFGSYEIECKIVNRDKINDKILIEFLDPWSNSITKKEIEKSELIIS